MKRWLMETTSPDLEPQELRRRIQESSDSEIRLRRSIFGVSILGIASMAAVSLYQLGTVRHLPDPPTRWPHFHSDKVNTSDEAFGYGMPDGPLTIAAHAANIVLAASGPPERGRNRPWLPWLASLVSGAQAGVAAKYLFYTMPRVDKAWCPYCILDALTHFATFALTIPESYRALRGHWRQPPGH